MIKTTTATIKSKEKKEEKPKIVKETEKTKKKAVPKKVVKKQLPKPSRYIETIGRRKTAVARVRVWTKGEKVFLVNNKPCDEYFSVLELQKIAMESLEKMNLLDKLRVQVQVKGGGVTAQAEAIRHAIARVLVRINPNFRKRLKKAGYLTRDSRMRERKKFGLKRARRAPQWAKR